MSGVCKALRDLKGSGRSSGVCRTFHFYLNVLSKPARAGGPERGDLWYPGGRKTAPGPEGSFNEPPDVCFVSKDFLRIVSYVIRKTGLVKSWAGSFHPGMTREGFCLTILSARKIHTCTVYIESLITREVCV